MEEQTTSSITEAAPAKPTPQQAKKDEARKPGRAMMLALLIFVSTAMGFLGGWLGAEGRISSGDLSTTAEQQIVSTERYHRP